MKAERLVRQCEQVKEIVVVRGEMSEEVVLLALDCIRQAATVSPSDKLRAIQVRASEGEEETQKEEDADKSIIGRDVEVQMSRQSYA